MDKVEVNIASILTSAIGAVIVSLLLAACAAAEFQPTPTSATSPTLVPIDTVTPAPTAEPSHIDTPTVKPATLSEDTPPSGAPSEFKTDFSKHSVAYAEILSGGPPKDGIPAIDDPKFVVVDEANTWLKPQEPVILLKVGDDVRAYPLQILIWHEIVNDTVGDVPVVVTFCPLCNTGIVFERTVNGQVLDFGTTGRLRFSNLIMYDRQTETWWQQATGDAIAGELTGAQLVFRPVAIVAWQDFKSAYPKGQVLSRDTGFSRLYGRNPYTGYDDVNNPPFLYVGPQIPGVLAPVARVLTVELKGEAVAYPYEVLKKIHVVNDVVGGTDVVVLWMSGTASALDSDTVAAGRDVGSAAAYMRKLDGQNLNFVYDLSRIIDKETGSEWDTLGRAISGKLLGKRLTPIVAINHFWFSWAAFRPETHVYQP
ncbi:MAG: DUF3179 domain-containing protein [Chloroflexi bacterium]|nr:DUF3179 domain-containing protein [Chloroflexota bacterium]